MKIFVIRKDWKTVFKNSFTFDGKIGRMSDCQGSNILINNRLISVSGFDEGIISEGRSVYEIIRVIEGVPLFMEDHLERLFISIRKAGLKSSLTLKEIEKRILLLVASECYTEGNIRIVLHFPDPEVRKEPVFLAYYTSHRYPEPEQYKNGVDTALFEGSRNQPHTKIIDAGFRERIENFIKERNVYEALLVDEKGFVTEGSKSNFFALCGDKILTAPEKDVLPGITRKYIFSICKRSAIPLSEEKIHMDHLTGMDAAFITGTSPKVLPVRSINGIIYDVDNNLTGRLKEEYEMLVNAYIKGSHNTTFST